MFSGFKLQNTRLIRELVIANFKIRYQGSVFGYLWSLLKPIITFTVLYVVFSRILLMGREIPHYSVNLFIGIVIWTFFTEATTMGLHSIVDNEGLIRKVALHKIPLVMAAVFSAFINFLLNLMVVFIFIVISKEEINYVKFTFFPFIILELLIYSLSVALILAALYVKFRDIAYIWDVILQVMFYGTPIIYPLSLVSTKLVKLISFNPMVQIIQWSRQIILGNEISNLFFDLLISIGMIIAISLFAFWFFHRKSKTFAEDI